LFLRKDAKRLGDIRNHTHGVGAGRDLAGVDLL